MLCGSPLVHDERGQCWQLSSWSGVVIFNDVLVVEIRDSQIIFLRVMVFTTCHHSSSNRLFWLHKARFLLVLEYKLVFRLLFVMHQAGLSYCLYLSSFKGSIWSFLKGAPLLLRTGDRLILDIDLWHADPVVIILDIDLWHADPVVIIAHGWFLAIWDCRGGVVDA